jgi:hypothetical protein
MISCPAMIASIIQAINRKRTIIIKELLVLVSGKPGLIIATFNVPVCTYRQRSISSLRANSMLSKFSNNVDNLRSQ